MGARRWRQREANRRYRSSEQGKCRRRAQSCRYRARVQERQRIESSFSSDGEGYPHPDEGKDLPASWLLCVILENGSFAFTKIL